MSSFYSALIYEKVLEYQSKHNEGPMKYHLSSEANGETTDPASQESSTGVFRNYHLKTLRCLTKRDFC
jgi:hypothetical protein